jgi:hypothetical protein
MSIEFSNTTTKRGLVQMYEKEIGANYGDVSGNSEALAEFTVRVNNTLDNYLLLWASSAGTWQGDDTNHETGGSKTYPIITANIVSGQRDYPFTVDDNSIQITDISKVLILQSATETNYVEIFPVDELNTNLSEILINTTTGTPRQYGKLSNGIFLDAIPNYSVSAGIKMIVNREGSSFLTTDTTKTPGVPTYHEYFYLKPAFEKASILGSSNLTSLEKKVIDLEGSERLRITGKIKEFFSQRERDIRHIMTNKKINYI